MSTTRLDVAPGCDTDVCPNCGIHRKHAGYLRESCGEDFRHNGCFVIANVADRLLREHSGTLRKLADDD